MKYLRIFEEFTDEYSELEVRQSSIPNAGLGLFTLVDIDKDTEIAEFTGKVITEEEGSELKGERSHYLVGRLDGTLLDVFDSDSPAIRANDAHGTKFKNNSGIFEDEDGRMWLTSTRNIRAGEEIFCEYGDSYWDNWEY